MTHSVYCLIDPRDGNPFYVGVTKLKLEYRLRGHIKPSKSTKNSWSIALKRQARISEIIDSGLMVEIKLIELVSRENAEKREAFHYHKFIKKGYILLQSSSHLNYSKVRQNEGL